MQTHFFVIVKTEAHKDFALERIARETILSLVEQEFGAEARDKCETDPDFGIKRGLKGTAWNYLSGKFHMFELYDYDLAGAMTFLAAARGMGPCYELRAVQMVQALRDELSEAIDKSINSVRSQIIEKLSQNVKWTRTTEHVERVREVLSANVSTLKAML